LYSNERYAANSKEKLEYKENIIALTALVYTPLSLVEHEASINLKVESDPMLKRFLELGC
jgi:hypothetical protein